METEIDLERARSIFLELEEEVHEGFLPPTNEQETSYRQTKRIYSYDEG